MKQKYKLTARFGPYGYLIPSILVFAVFLFYPFFINDNDSKEGEYYRRGLREAIEEANKLLSMKSIDILKQFGIEDANDL